MMLVQERLIDSIYPHENRPILCTIRINSTTRIAELVFPYLKRILKHKNKLIMDRNYHTKTSVYTTHEKSKCSMIYTKLLCHACYQEIKIRSLYLSKNGERGRSKFYHISCAVDKHILVI